jgi:hypothetical protein
MVTSKRCIDCGKRKPVGDFYRVHKDSEHRQSRCKPCDNRKRMGGKDYRKRRDELGPVEAVRLADGTLQLVRKVRGEAAPAERPPRRIRITEAEILSGLHDYAIDYERKIATCRRCGTTADEAMQSARKARCRVAKQAATR